MISCHKFLRILPFSVFAKVLNAQKCFLVLHNQAILVQPSHFFCAIQCSNSWLKELCSLTSPETSSNCTHCFSSFAQLKRDWMARGEVPSLGPQGLLQDAPLCCVDLVLTSGPGSSSRRASEALTDARMPFRSLKVRGRCGCPFNRMSKHARKIKLASFQTDV